MGAGKRLPRRAKGGKARPQKKGAAYEELVATVVQAMDPGATVEHSIWVQGPDGKRDMDVVVRGRVEGVARSILIECKDYDINRTGKVGIGVVDALDSKRRDLGMDAAIICSNSGFEDTALNKGRRVGIGLVSALMSGDSRVKFVVEDEIFIKRYVSGKRSVQYEFADGTSPPGDIQSMEAATYDGKSISAWMWNRIGMMAVVDREYDGRQITDRIRFTQPVKIQADGEEYALKALTITSESEMQWFSQRITVDATSGIFNHLRGRVQLASGMQSLMLHGVDAYNGGTPITSPPPIPADLLAGETYAEFKIPLHYDNAADLDPLVMPEDLDMRIPPLGH